MNQPVSIFQRAGVRLVNPAATANLGPGMHPRISIKGGRFTLIDAGGTKHPWPSLSLPVIIVGANPEKSKVYYANGYDPDSNEPPTCYSDNGIGPSMNASIKQARTCAECEHGMWGSSTSEMTGKPSKSCNDKKKLAVIVIGDPAGHAYEFQIPPATLKNLNKYSTYVESFTTPDGARKADLTDLVTYISFVADQTGVLEFKEAGWIDQVGPDGVLYASTAVDGGAAIAAKLDALWDETSHVIDDLVGLNDRPWQPAAAVAPPPAQAYLEQQPHGGQLQRGSVAPAQPITGPYAGPVGAQPVQPRQAFAAQPAQLQPGAGATGVAGAPPPAPSKRGGARPGAGRKPQTQLASPQQPLTGEVLPPHQPAPMQAPQPTPAFAPGPAAGVEADIPSFLRRGAAPAGPVPAAAPAANHGMTAAPAPPQGMQAALDAAFSLGTGHG